MKTAVGDNDWLLLNICQDEFDVACRKRRNCIDTVARVLNVSFEEAQRMLLNGKLSERLAESGIEIYNQRECQSSLPWPDSQTLFMWGFTLIGIGFASYFGTR